MGQQGGDHHQQKAAQQEGQVIDKPGHHTKKQVPRNENAGVQGGNDGVVVAVGIFQHLIAEKIHGEFVQNIFGQFTHHFFHRYASRKQWVKSSTV